ncbi:MAG: potassium transporter [Rhodocyclales bacterium GWA2_65_20]|nr:MAG: potassium transporter [Rhodocyclales bacterium GWA2_65_20]
MHQNLLAVFLLLTAAVGAVAVARRLRLPPILAYLAIGIALGPHGAEILAGNQDVKSLAEFGIVFLMFSIGLEFSLPRLKAMRSLVFGFGAAQLLFTAAATAFATWFGYGQGWRASVAVGLAVAMSSTAIVARMLSERFELHSRSGRQTMGVLLFQDLAVVPCLILFPAMADPQGNLAYALAVGAAQAAVVLGVLVVAGQWLTKRVFDTVTRYRSDELFVLTTLAIVVGLAYATHAAGLSLALGAFVGGMLISETIYRHQVEADIRPFRDILLGLFFVTVGMLLDIGFVLANIHRLLLAVLLLVAGKGIVVMVLALVAKNSADSALRTAAQIAQAGEFGLVLIGLAFDLDLIGVAVFQLTLAAMLISMFLAPFLIELAARLGGEMAKGDWAHKAKAVHDIAVGAFGLEGHVIVCGFGRTGRRIGEFLAAEGIPFLALEVDPQQVRRAAPVGGKVAFGSADRIEVLKAAGLARARGLVVAYPDTQSAERILRLVRHHRPDLPVVVRSYDESTVGRLKEAGATEVIPEVLEGSLMIAAETLVQLGIPVEQAMARARSVRAQRYASLREYYRDYLKPHRR